MLVSVLWSDSSKYSLYLYSGDYAKNIGMQVIMEGMQKNVVITGVNGFVGHHLNTELRESGCSVVGVGREDTCDFVDTYLQSDLAQQWPEGAESADAVIHLAGLAATGPSFDNPQTYINLNSAMVTNMCEHYLKQDKKPRIVIVSSGSIYDPSQPLPISEDGKIGLNSPYSVSKVLVENQAEYYRNRGLDCVVVRPFNHIGPGQLSGFIVPDFYEKIVGAEPNTAITVGNIETKRDYTDVRDIVKAYGRLALAESLQCPVYNVCSGNSYSGKEIFELLCKALNRTDVSFEVDPSLVRPSDIPEIIGDASRLRTELNWQPSISIEQTIADVVSSRSV